VQIEKPKETKRLSYATIITKTRTSAKIYATASTPHKKRTKPSARAKPTSLTLPPKRACAKKNKELYSLMVAPLPLAPTAKLFEEQPAH